MDFSVLVTIGTVAGFVNLPVITAGVAAQMLFYRAVRGTRLRYVAKSIYHAFLVIQVFVGPLMWLGYLFDSNWIWLGLYTLIVPCMAWNLHRFRTHENDEDDFWNGLGGRIKRALTRPVRRVVPVTR